MNDVVKICSSCKAIKPLGDFHSQPSGKLGRHSYCKPCANRVARESRVRNYQPGQRRKWQFQTRYGLSIADVDRMRVEQDGKCAICERDLAGTRECIDHNHATGAVRGLLCHKCNIHLHPVEDEKFLAKALEYLGRHA